MVSYWKLVKLILVVSVMLIYFQYLITSKRQLAINIPLNSFTHNLVIPLASYHAISGNGSTAKNKTGIFRIKQNYTIYSLTADTLKHYESKTVQHLRQDKIEQYCTKDGKQRIHNVSDIDRDAYLVQKLHFVISAIPKTGRTAWQMLVWNNTLPSGSQAWKDGRILAKTWENKFLYDAGIKLVSTYKKSELEELIPLYFTMFTVRHPLSRLESFYVDKLIHQPYYHRLHGKDIIKLYRNRTKVNDFAFKTGQGVTFEEFLKYVIHNSTLDGHWCPFNVSLKPCNFHYDFVAKLETANEDMDYIIKTKLAGKGSHVVKNQRNDHKRIVLKEGVLLELFSALKDPKYYLDKLMNIYQTDMDMFGYGYKFVDNKVVAFCDLYTDDGKCV